MSNRYWLVSTATFSTITDFCGGEVSGATNDLQWNPHPTEYYPYSEVKVQGTGDLAGLGYALFKWTSGGGILSGEMWNYLMSFFAGSEPSVEVYVKTRTDRCVLNALGEYEYEYKWYLCKMHRPTGEPVAPFRFRNVEVIFTHATGA